MSSFDAVILAGGRGERMGGVDKAVIAIGGSTLLQCALDAVGAARTIVCVGPERPTDPSVTWTRERPPGGGPVAALSAGLDRVEAPIVTVFAVDHPFVTPEITSLLVQTCALEEVDAALAEDGLGVGQPLLAAYKVEPLRERVRAIGSPTGASMTRVLNGLCVVTVPAHDEAQDCDTPQDLERARRKVEGRR